MTPTLFANDNPQMNVIGTAGLEGRSAWWWNIRKRALSSDPGAFGYVGHTAERLSLDGNGHVVSDVPDLSDRDVWRSVNPALRAGRGRGIEFLEEQFRNIGPHRFAEEHLCVWAPEPDVQGEGPIPLVRWSELVDGDSMVAGGDVWLALDAPPDRMSATFAIAGKRDDSLLHADVRRHVPPVDMSRLVELARILTLEAHPGHPLLIPAGSPALAWRAELEAAGVPLEVMQPAEVAAAFGYLGSQVREGTFRHRGIPEMSNAVAGLAVKSSGDVDVPARRNSSANIAPIVAAMCALYRVPTQAEKPRGVFLAVT